MPYPDAHWLHDISTLPTPNVSRRSLSLSSSSSSSSSSTKPLNQWELTSSPAYSSSSSDSSLGSNLCTRVQIQVLVFWVWRICSKSMPLSSYNLRVVSASLIWGGAASWFLAFQWRNYRPCHRNQTLNHAVWPPSCWLLRLAAHAPLSHNACSLPLIKW